jgi:hypothetical protein
MGREGLSDKDHTWPANTDEEFETNFGRYADLFERVGKFICWECWNVNGAARRKAAISSCAGLSFQHPI